MENAMWNCVSCELWSAYKMQRLGLITKTLPVLRIDGALKRNPLVITDAYVHDGEIVYGELLRGTKADSAREEVKKAVVDFTLLDREVDEIVWRFTNLMPGCLIKSIDGIRAKKKFFWDQTKLPNRHWLAANMAVEGLLGFTAFNTRQLTGTDVIDFVKYRQYLADGRIMDEVTLAELLPGPKGK